jgi:agmatine deiminase
MMNAANQSSPFNYTMPAEWEPHEAVWLSWPHDPISFPFLDKAEEEYAAFVAEVSSSERVELQVLNDDMQQRAGQLLSAHGVDLARVRFHHASYADIWFRDYGPIFVRDGKRESKLAMIKWIFNAWGGKYETLKVDDRTAYRIREVLRLPLLEPGIVLEGGSIEVNGQGTLLTTEQCLLNPNRNPQLSKKEIERYLRDYLGVRQFIWLKEGIEGDDTDGHIDDIARFVNPTTVVCALTNDAADPDHAPLRANFELLTAATDQCGRKLNVIPLPTPGWVGDEEGRLPASYANFYISNTKVLVPIFGQPNDSKAVAVIQSVFPGRTVIGLMAKHLVYGLGTFHCMSQQQPSE